MCVFLVLSFFSSVCTKISFRYHNYHRCLHVRSPLFSKNIDPLRRVTSLPSPSTSWWPIQRRKRRAAKGWTGRPTDKWWGEEEKERKRERDSYSAFFLSGNHPSSPSAEDDNMNDNYRRTFLSTASSPSSSFFFSAFLFFLSFCGILKKQFVYKFFVYKFFAITNRMIVDKQHVCSSRVQEASSPDRNKKSGFCKANEIIFGGQFARKWDGLATGAAT